MAKTVANNLFFDRVSVAEHCTNNPCKLLVVFLCNGQSGELSGAALLQSTVVNNDAFSAVVPVILQSKSSDFQSFESIYAVFDLPTLYVINALSGEMLECFPKTVEISQELLRSSIERHLSNASQYNDNDREPKALKWWRKAASKVGRNAVQFTEKTPLNSATNSQIFSGEDNSADTMSQQLSAEELVYILEMAPQSEESGTTVNRLLSQSSMRTVQFGDGAQPLTIENCNQSNVSDSNSDDNDDDADSAANKATDNNGLLSNQSIFVNVCVSGQCQKHTILLNRIILNRSNATLKTLLGFVSFQTQHSISHKSQIICSTANPSINSEIGALMTEKNNLAEWNMKSDANVTIKCADVVCIKSNKKCEKAYAGARRNLVCGKFFDIMAYFGGGAIAVMLYPIRRLMLFTPSSSQYQL